MPGLFCNPSFSSHGLALSPRSLQGTPSLPHSTPMHNWHSRCSTAFLKGTWWLPDVFAQLLAHFSLSSAGPMAPPDHQLPARHVLLFPCVTRECSGSKDELHWAQWCAGLASCYIQLSAPRKGHQLLQKNHWVTTGCGTGLDTKLNKVGTVKSSHMSHCCSNYSRRN